jgi:hypothetical protein
MWTCRGRWFKDGDQCQVHPVYSMEGSLDTTIE